MVELGRAIGTSETSFLLLIFSENSKIIDHHILDASGFD
jgi:hypothetical protein